MVEVYPILTPYMKLLINDKSTISNIQREFNNEFPFLRIEFFKKMHKPGEGLSKNVMYNSDMVIGDIRSNHLSGELQIDGDIKVSELEDRMAKEFGLSIQIFRKSGNVWLETTRTDSWTLKQQNEEGESLQSHIDGESKGDYDYHEQE